MHDSSTDEQTSLLTPTPRSSPIPWSQFSITLWIQFIEPLSTQVISPFAPQLVRDIGVTHGNDAQVGYYVGILHSVFYMVQAITVLYWSRISDHLGRKPVLLIGLSSVSLFMLCFGFSKTFWGLVLSRAFYSALNANVGVIKGMIAELSDGTNLAQMIAFVPITWASGGTIGPFVGGLLSHPAKHFPEVFGNNFWKTYPYLLPCIVPSVISALCWVITYLFLRETVKKPKSIRSLWSRNGFSITASAAGESEESARHLMPKSEGPKCLRELLTRKVLITATNYGLLALIDIALRTLQPVIFSTPIALGGLDLSPLSIGKVLSTIGFLNGFIQLFFFARIHNYLGSKRTFMIGLFMTFPVIIAFPIMNHVARTHGDGPLLWSILTLQILFTPGISFSFGAALIFVQASAPNRASLGAINGFCQMTISFIRAIGPALFNSLFAYSIEHRSMSGYLIYYLLAFILCSAIISASRLSE